MTAIAQKIDDLINPLRNISSKFLMPVLDLVIRLWMANIFFKSGWSKFENYLNGNWDTTISLFTDAHVVPGIPPEIAAIAGTGGEIILSTLLVIGLFTRFGAAGLFVMTLTIQYLVTDGFGDSLANPDHYFWMLLLLIPLIKGPGILSIDHWLVKLIRKS